MHSFKPGDRVMAVSPVDGRADLIGQCGTVVRINSKNIGVRFDNPFQGGHTCSGHCENRRGRYGFPEDFITEPDLSPDDDENALLDSFLASYQK